MSRRDTVIRGKGVLTIGISIVMGCAGTDLVQDDGAVNDTIEVTVVPVVMPDVPVSGEGRLAVTTATHQDQYRVTQDWPAAGERCENVAVVQVRAQADGYGFAMLLQSSQEKQLTLPLEPVNDSILPTASARIVLQVYPSDRAYVLKAVSGSAELDSLTTHVSGRFSATMVEGTYRDTVLASGSFEALPIVTVDDAHCRPLLASTDSLASDEGGA